MSAATQLCAATVTSRQGVRAGRPVAGSIRWCCSSPPRRQRASRCCSSRDRRGRGGSSRRRAGRRSSGTVVAMSPPAETQPSPTQRERIVDCLALDDAVQVEHHRLGAQEHSPAQPEREQRRDWRRLDRVALEGKRGEVAVVAGADQLRHRRPESPGHRWRELRRAPVKASTRAPPRPTSRRRGGR